MEAEAAAAAASVIMRARGRGIQAVIVLLQLVVFGWRCSPALAGGGALDSGPGYHHQAAGPQSGSASGAAKATSFTASLTDGIAKAVAHENRDRKYSFHPYLGLLCNSQR